MSAVTNGRRLKGGAELQIFCVLPSKSQHNSYESYKKKVIKENVTFHRIGEVYLVPASVSLFKYLLCFLCYICYVHFICSPVFIIYLICYLEILLLVYVVCLSFCIIL